MISEDKQSIAKELLGGLGVAKDAHRAAVNIKGIAMQRTDAR